MADETSYEDLSEAELRALVLDRPDKRLPPHDELRAIFNEWIKRRSDQVARKS
jgi:hypothetical protein